MGFCIGKGCDPSALEIIVSILIIVFVVWAVLFVIGWILHRKRSSPKKIAVTTFVTAVILVAIWFAWVIWSARNLEEVAPAGFWVK